MIGKQSDDKWVLNDQAQLSFVVSAPVSGKGLQNVRYAPRLGAGLRQFTQNLLASGLLDSLKLLLERESLALCPEIPAEHLEVFRYLNLLVPSNQVPELAVFAPFLSQLPDLTPGLKTADLPQDLIFNPSLEIQFTPEPSQLLAYRPLLWLSQPEQNARFFYCLEPEMAQWLKTRSQEQIAYLSLEARQTLYQARVLLAAKTEPCASNRLPNLEQQKQFFERNQYLVLRDLIPPFLIGALRTYIRQLYDNGYFQMGDTQVKERAVFHNEPLMRFLHQQMYHEIKAFFGSRFEMIKPSYNFLAVYQAGATLPKHTDREQCTWNMSLVLDMQQELAQDSVWPIYLETEQDTVAVKLNLGDALLYPGSHFKHWREAYDQSVSVVMFHFVTHDYEGILG